MAIIKLKQIDLGQGDTLDVDYYLNAAYDDISDANQELPSVVEWLNEKYQGVLQNRLQQKQKIKSVEARAWLDLRNGDFVEKGYGGKATTTALKYAVALDPHVIKAHDDYAVLMGWERRLVNTMRSLQAKLELVRSTEATRRKVFTDEKIFRDEPSHVEAEEGDEKL